MDLVWPGIALGLLTTFVWSYWSTLVELINEWSHNQDYSVGGLVPIVAVYLAWSRRKDLRDLKLQPCWWGVLVILLGQAARLFGLLFVYESAERYSMVITAVGAILLVAGWPVFVELKWLWPFLLLMVPLPGRVHNLISGPLQRMATVGAVFSLELFGVMVAREGNVIILNETERLAVAEACSGLRMLTAFVIVAGTLAFVVNRPRWQKLALVASSVPIAILCNLLRIVATALLCVYASSELAERFFHDFAGITMMPLAILMLAGELALFNLLVVPDEPSEPPRSDRSKT